MKDLFVASREICQQLFALSGWQGTEHYWFRDWLHKDQWRVWSLGQANETTIPAYDLGYLLRRLPHDTRIGFIHPAGEERCGLAETYHYDQDSSYCELLASAKSATPEDALCLVAIALFRRGILPR